MKEIRINPFMNNGVVYLEPGEECRFVMNTSSPDGSFIVKTSIDVRVNPIPTFTHDSTFKPGPNGTIPDEYIPHVARLIGIKNVKFEQFHNAVITADKMNRQLGDFGRASIANFNVLVGFKSSHIVMTHGWTRGDIFEVKGNAFDFELEIPVAHYFGESGDVTKKPEEPKKLSGSITCPHCGYVYLPDRGIHSVVTKVQPDTIFKPFDQKYSAVYYDAWDCPRCGGQFVGSERSPRCK